MANLAEATAGAVANSQSTGRWVLAATILGSSMAFIDGTVVNVALPVLQKELGATVADAQWVVEAYTLFLASLMLVGGSLGDRLGRRRVFAVGIVLFTAASIWCGFAPDPIQLIIARAFQGVGGALFVPGSLAIISATFPQETRGRAIGTWSGFTTITTVLGPVLGGWLVEHTSWRWVFFINAPLAVAVLAIVALKVPESRDETASGRLDWLGALLATVGLGALVYGLIESGNRGLSDPLVLATVVGGVVALAAFVVVEARSHSPMMPLSMFKSSTFSGANILTFLLYGALGGTLFFVPFNLLQVQNYTPTATGAAMLPFIILLSTLSRWSGGLVARYGAKLPLVIGPAIAGLGFALFALPGTKADYWTGFFPAMTVLGLGMAITVAPLTTTVMGAAEVSKSGIASGINNAVSRVAGLLAVAVLGIVMLAAFNSSMDSRLSTMQLSPSVRQSIDEQRIRLAGADIPHDIAEPQRTQLQEAIDESFVAGFRLVMLTGAGLAFASAISAWLMVEGKKEVKHKAYPSAGSYSCVGSD
jgi:EmrB/QacA subfamily drug resistance transporter